MCSVGLGSPGGHFPVGTPTVALESHARILGRYVIDLPFYTWNGTLGCWDDITLQTIEGWRPETISANGRAVPQGELNSWAEGGLDDGNNSFAVKDYGVWGLKPSSSYGTPLAAMLAASWISS